MIIGILTLPAGANYGGILQNWALQQTLVEMGHDAVTLSHRYASSILDRLKLACAQAISDFWGLNTNPKISFGIIPAPMEEFVSQNLRKIDSGSIFTKKVIRDNGFDAIVVGSDQVWRRGYNVFTQEMYLRFTRGLDIRRIAYAASFGTSTWDYPAWLSFLCGRYLRRFDAVSCREFTGSEFCRKNFRVEAKTVLDPTMLIDRGQYSGLCNSIPIDRKKYLLAFVLDGNNSKKKKIEEIAAVQGLEVRFVYDGSKLTLSIPQWIAAFRDATAIVTDSFHGTVFSILFQKPFLTIINQGRGGARFDTLIKHFNIGSRIKNLDEIDSHFNLNDIDWGKIETLLREKKKQSEIYLKTALSGSENHLKQ